MLSWEVALSQPRAVSRRR